MRTATESPRFLQRRSGEMCLSWCGKELQLSHAQFMDFLGVAVKVQPIEWSWFCSEDFDIDWYGKFYGQEHVIALREGLLKQGVSL